MVRPERIHSLEDVKMWIAEHDGRIDAWWDAQHRLNSDNAGKFTNLERRITAVEKKVFLISGAASGAGALIGTLVAVWAGLGAG